MNNKNFLPVISDFSLTPNLKDSLAQGKRLFIVLLEALKMNIDFKKLTYMLDHDFISWSQKT